jgi:hypothetical protein
MALAEDEGCALVDEVQPGKYRGFFTNNQNLVIRSLHILNDLLPVSEKIGV